MNEIAEPCAPFEVELSALLDRQLDAPRAAAVQAHADSCRDCARRLEALRAVDGELRRIAAVPIDPARIGAIRSALATQLHAPASDVARRPFWRRAPARRRHWIAAAALTATAAASAALLFVMQPPAPLVAPAREVVAMPATAAMPSADAERAARDLAAGVDAPIGANEAPDGAAPAASKSAAANAATVDLIDLLTDLPPQTRAKLRDKLATLPPEESTRLLIGLSRRQELSPQQRSELRASLAQLGVLSADEQEQALRQ